MASILSHWTWDFCGTCYQPHAQVGWPKMPAQLEGPSSWNQVLSQWKHQALWRFFCVHCCGIACTSEKINQRSTWMEKNGNIKLRVPGLLVQLWLTSSVCWMIFVAPSSHKLNTNEIDTLRWGPPEMNRPNTLHEGFAWVVFNLRGMASNIPLNNITYVPISP